MDVGKRYDQMLDEMEFLYEQRREARTLVSQWITAGSLTKKAGIELLTLLAAKEKEGVKQ